MIGHSRSPLPWGLLLLVCLSIYAAAVASNLGNYFPIRGDEVLIMSASHKLATTGVPGSDLVDGLSGAGERFFLNLPVQNLLQAGVFAVGGTGILQARLPSLGAGLAIIVLVWWFARQAFEPRVAALAVLALVFWRSNLIDSEPRPPLLALGHSGRYDLVVVALFWTTVVLLRACLLRPRRLMALLVGVSGGLALLTQFYGIAALLLTATAYLLQWGRSAWRQPEVRWSLLGCLLVVAPYAAFVWLNLDAFQGQAALQGPRVTFFNLQFWLSNLLREPERYATVLHGSAAGLAGMPALGPWLLPFAALPGVVPLVTRSRDSDAARALPWLSLVMPLIVLALAEQTKAVLYASLLVPSLCLSLACGIDALLAARPGHTRGPAARVVLTMVAGLVLAVVTIEGVRGYVLARREARQVTPYLSVGRDLAVLMPDDAPVLGPWRWWWALADRPYLAVNGLWWHSQRVALAGSHPSFREEVLARRAAYLVVDRDFLGDIDRTRPAYRLDALTFLENCSSVVGRIDDVSYGVLEVRRISCAAGASPDITQ